MDDDYNDIIQEQLNWEPGSVSGSKPSPKYTKLAEAARKVMPEAKACAMFCGGKKCRYCIDTAWTEEQMAIKGLFSHWVTENILAMARPTTPLIKQHNIMQQFKSQGIKSIINVQKPGEHKSCGPPLEDLGFSYNPQEFMDRNIFFYNFGWNDYGVTSFARLLDMVKVMQFALQAGKVAIHCHAGLGRTGVLIGCFLCFNNRMNGDDAIHFVRAKRPGSIQTSGQMSCIQDFAKYLEPIRIIFSDIDPNAIDFTLKQYLKKQDKILHGYEARRLKHIPKILYIICERLLALAGRRPKHHKGEKLCEDKEDESITDKVPKSINQSALSNVDHNLQNQSNSGAELGSLTSLRKVQSESMINPRSHRCPEARKSEADMSQHAVFNISDTIDENSCEEDSSRTNFSDSDSLFGIPSATESSLEKVITALSTEDYSSEVKERVLTHKTQLNKSASWRLLVEEDDPVTLCALLYEWLDHLKEPILRVQDVNLLLKHLDNPQAGLKRLEKCHKATVEYLIEFVSKLEPLYVEQENIILAKFLTALTHHDFVAEVIETPTTTTPRQGLSRNISSLSTLSITSLSDLQEKGTQKVFKFFYQLLDCYVSRDRLDSTQE